MIPIEKLRELLAYVRKFRYSQEIDEFEKDHFEEIETLIWNMMLNE